MEGINRQNKEDSYESETILDDNIMVDICLYRFVQTHRVYNSKSEPSCQLCTLVIIYQCRFISCNKHITLVGDADSFGEAMNVEGQ